MQKSKGRYQGMGQLSGFKHGRLRLTLSMVIISLLGSTGLSWGAIGWADIVDPASLLTKLTKKRCATGFAVSLSGPVIYCIKRKLSLPNGDFQSECKAIDQGKLGFSWTPRPTAPPVAQVKAYACPDGATARQEENRFFCEFSGLFIPENVVQLRSYCTYLHRGYLGYSYRLP